MSTVDSETAATIEPLDDHGSAVRFESQCVVIPDLEHRSRRPKVVTKSYALPLWRKRTSSACPSSASAPSEDSSEDHLVLRLPLPTFSRKHHSTTRSVDHAPLPPCLVHRAQPSVSSCTNIPSASPTRHPRTPRQPSHSPSRPDIVTVPLRPCCAACQPVTEAAVVGGDAWTEHFSRGASRRRSTSADATLRTITVSGSAASASYGTLGVSISVDEVDKRRRLSDTGLSILGQEALSDDAKAKGDCKAILRRAVASCSSAADTPSPPSGMTPATPRIPEEDLEEDASELFPLPSPKRTPSTSPAPSPAGSLSSLTVPQTSSPTPSTCSGDSVSLHLSKRQFLAPPHCSSSPSLGQSKLSGSMRDLTLAEDPPRAPSPSLLSTFPTLSCRHRSRSPSPRISCIPPTPTDALSSAIPPDLPRPLVAPAPITIPLSPGASQPSSSPHHSPTHGRFSWRSKRSVSADMSPPSSCSPSASPTLSTSSSTKMSFSMSSPRHIITDVLRGVGAMNVSPIGPGM